jgi:hypothetical protein
MEDGGLIHVDGKGGQSIPIVDNVNDLLEETLGLVAHFLGGALCGVRGHAMDEAVFCHKVRNGRLLGRESLLGESRTQLAGLLDEALARDKDPLPTPLICKRHQLLSEGIHTNHWAFMLRLLLRSSRLLEQGTISLPPQNLGVMYL